MINFSDFSPEKFHQVIAKALGNYIRNTNVFLKTGAHLERSAMLNKTVEMARGVHGTINLENNAGTISPVDFDAFVRCYNEQVAVFASAQQDLHKMVISLFAIHLVSNSFCTCFRS